MPRPKKAAATALANNPAKAKSRKRSPNPSTHSRYQDINDFYATLRLHTDPLFEPEHLKPDGQTSPLFVFPAVNNPVKGRPNTSSRFSCEAWGATAEFLNKLELKKGDAVFLYGQLRSRMFEHEGATIVSNYVSIFRLVLMRRSSDNSNTKLVALLDQQKNGSEYYPGVGDAD